jgi:hypothetical protein
MSNNNKITTFELALSRHIDIENAVLANDSSAFNALAEKFVNKKSAIDGMKAYLKSQQSSPRVLGIMIYSQTGREKLREWVGQGMSTGLLYQGMINDGAFWHKAGVDFPLADDIINGNEAWSFDPREFLSGAELLMSVPGLISSMVARLRRQGRISEAFRYMPMKTLTLLINQYPDVFEVEIEAVTHRPRRADEAVEPIAAIDLVRSYLDPQSAVEKMLGHNLK